MFENDAVFEALDEMVSAGRIRAYGVSVETCAQAIAAIARPHVATVQIILNCFRLKPLEEVLPAAQEAGVGIIARVPLASGLLSGRYDEDTVFAPDDHRSYNRHGEAFDVGETFAGVPFEVGLAAVRELKTLLDPGLSLAQFALRWVIDQPGVSTVIPGARNPRAGTRQRRQRGATAATRRSAGRRPGCVRPAASAARSRPLVASSNRQVDQRPALDAADCAGVRDLPSRERVLATEDLGSGLLDDQDVTRPVRRHHHGHGPPYAGLHSGRRRNPKAGLLVIHRPGQPDEIISASAFRRPARHIEQKGR